MGAFAGFLGEYVRLQQSQGVPDTTYYAGWLGPDDFEGLLEIVPDDCRYENIKEEEERIRLAK